MTKKFAPPRYSILEYDSIYLVGIKGVALSSLAQMLVDAGKHVSGWDVEEDFVTSTLLNRLDLKIDTHIPDSLPDHIQCVVYTAAHQAHLNPVVQTAVAQGIPVMSHAEALASLVNTKKGIAVCGVGGKSTTSAMMSWILDQLGLDPSFSVGVGTIPCLNKTGQWSDSEFCVVEADEYVTDPTAPSRGEDITPRFSYLQPYCVICTSLAYDHPDVYKNFEHTRETFKSFFLTIQENGYLIINGDNEALRKLSEEVRSIRPDLTILSYGTEGNSTIKYLVTNSDPSQTEAQLKEEDEVINFNLPVPGIHNISNAAACLTACKALSLPITKAAVALNGFTSTQRRFENKGLINGVQYFDDYAHHPREIKAVLDSVSLWSNSSNVYIAFQPHTFSRTKQLLNKFVEVLSQAPNLVILDIFASARESADSSISSDVLVEKIKQHNPDSTVQNLHTIHKLAEFCSTQLNEGDVCITLGAGDIYHVYDKLTTP